VWSHYYSCVVTLLQLYGHITTAVWSYYYSRVVTLLQLCGHITTAVWSHYYSCVVTLLQLCGHVTTAVWSHYYSCVVTLLQLCGHITTAVWSHYYSCGRKYKHFFLIKQIILITEMSCIQYIWNWLHNGYFSRTTYSQCISVNEDKLIFYLLI